ncbi:MAG: DNA topoisomerase IB [Cyanobacteria bacterium P01_A01_bin.37]
MEPNPTQVARQAGLRYITDEEPGIRRETCGRGFTYFDVNGNRIGDRTKRQYLKSLSIPPSWRNVWICPIENGYLQATGRDAKGRKQYRYHPIWRKLRNQAKFSRMLVFGESLPTIRQITNEHLCLNGLPRKKVLALVVQLLESTLIRIGNAEYAQSNNSYGLTTLRTRHINIEGKRIEFNFVGKSGVKHSLEIEDKRLANVIKRCYEIPGYSVFQYVDEEGQRQNVDSGEVNDYLKEISGEDFTAKDLRTWAGTVLTAKELGHRFVTQSEVPQKGHITDAIKAVAKQLGNRPATCRKYYVHPAIPKAYLQGDFSSLVAEIASEIEHIEPHEHIVLKLLSA